MSRRAHRDFVSLVLRGDLGHDQALGTGRRSGRRTNEDSQAILLRHGDRIGDSAPRSIEDLLEPREVRALEHRRVCPAEMIVTNL